MESAHLLALSRLLKAPFWLLASDQLLRTRYKTEVPGARRRTSQCCRYLGGQIPKAGIQPVSRTGFIGKPAMDGEYHLIRLRRVIQRLILIPQPEKFLLPIPFADVRTQFHEGIVNGGGHCVGMLSNHWRTQW